jgi:polyphosphate kinase
MFMGSADWMSRNLDRRIEVLTPVLDKDIFEELNDILSIQFSDNVKARVHTPDETNPFIDKKDGDKSCRSQTAIYQYLEQKHS